MKKYLIGLLVAMFIVVPFVGKAEIQQLTQEQKTNILQNLSNKTGQNMTISELQAMIAALKEKIAELQKSRPIPSCQFTHDLSLGDGEDDGLTKEITALQKVLISGGFLNIKKPTGYFGKMTKAAVERWQQALGGDTNADITGEVRPRDREVLCRNNNVSCPQLTVARPDGWCKDGTIMPGVKDSNGCYGAPRCINKNSSISINSVSGPNSLAVGQTGTWSVNASALAGMNLTYYVNWGEGVPLTTSPVRKESGVQQTSTFSHSYGRPGTYTVTFSVGCDGNTAPNPACRTMNTAQTSLTVVVGNNSQAPIINSATYQTGKDAAGITGERLQNVRIYFNGSLVGKENHTFWTNNQISFIPPTYQPGTYQVYVQGPDYRSNTVYLTISGDSLVSAPSIKINGYSSGQSSDNNLNIYTGDSFRVLGTPVGLSGLSYGNSGFTRAFNFSDIFTCTNNEASSAGEWWLSCTANRAGSGKVDIEIYRNGNTYRSNTVYVNVKDPAPLNVIFPGEADGTSVVKGRTYQVTWTGRDVGVSTYSVYLVGGGLGSAGSRYLGLVNVATQNAFTWTVPSDIPTSMGYQIQFSGAGVTGGNSSSFIIANGQG